MYNRTKKEANEGGWFFHLLYKTFDRQNWRRWNSKNRILTGEGIINNNYHIIVTNFLYSIDEILSVVFVARKSAVSLFTTPKWLGTHRYLITNLELGRNNYVWEKLDMKRLNIGESKKMTKDRVGNRKR